LAVTKKKKGDEMATQQDVLEIVTDFMLNAPPGEFLDVVHDIRGLLADETILNSTALPTFREYNTDQMIQVALPVPGTFPPYPILPPPFRSSSSRSLFRSPAK
jgi:hypothetical protein